MKNNGTVVLLHYIITAVNCFCALTND